MHKIKLLIDLKSPPGEDDESMKIVHSADDVTKPPIMTSCSLHTLLRPGDDMASSFCSSIMTYPLDICFISLLFTFI